MVLALRATMYEREGARLSKVTAAQIRAPRCTLVSKVGVVIATRLEGTTATRMHSSIARFFRCAKIAGVPQITISLSPQKHSRHSPLHGFETISELEAKDLPEWTDFDDRIRCNDANGLLTMALL